MTTARKGFDLPQDIVEAGLLHSCTDLAQWLTMQKFSEEDFLTHRDIFQFMGKYLAEYGHLPTSSQLNTRFDWQPPIGDFSYYLKELDRYSLARQGLVVLQEGFDHIYEPLEAIDMIINKLSLLRSNQSNHMQASDMDATERFEKYLARTQFLFNSNQILGLRTGMKIFDNSGQGWLPGSLVGLYARPGQGKTWWLMWQGIQSWKLGKKILVIAPEMPANMLELRLDVLWGAQLDLPIEYSGLMMGDPSIKDNYRVLTEYLSQSNRWWTYSHVGKRQVGVSLNDLAGLIRQHEPDLVLIDGVSFLRSSTRGQGVWENMLEICYGLKELATLYEIPILITHQSRRGENARDHSEKFVMPSLNDAAYGDAFVQACSDVITMVGDENSKHVIWYSIRKTRERGIDPPPRMALIVDFNKGKLFDVSDLGHDPEKVGQEVRRLIG